MSLKQTILDSSFPLAWSHVVKVRIISHIPFGKTVAGIHFHERSLVTFGEIFPIISPVAFLIAHMVRCDKNILTFELLFPILDG